MTGWLMVLIVGGREVSGPGLAGSGGGAGVGDLPVIQVPVEAVLGVQFLVGAAFDDLSLVHDQNEIGLDDGAVPSPCPGRWSPRRE